MPADDATNHTGRHVALDGCHNFRDIGGYLTADGREVRRRALYRSAEMCALSDADRGVLARLGIAAVYDLRSPEEAAARPNRLPPGVLVEARTTPSARARPTETLEDMIADDTIPDRDDDDHTRTYTGQLDHALTAEFRRVLELARDARERPLVFHCAAGKDRTGLATAIVLGTLGVPDGTIVEDYNLTTRYFARPRLAELRPLLRAHAVDEDRIVPFLRARTAVFERTLDHVHQRWGGFDSYVTDCLGLDAAFPDELRDALLATTPQ